MWPEATLFAEGMHVSLRAHMALLSAMPTKVRNPDIPHQPAPKACSAYLPAYVDRLHHSGDNQTFRL